MLIIFTVKGQKITHDLGKRTLVSDSVGEVQAAFTFDSSWDNYDKVIVFTNSSNKNCSKPKPIAYEGEPIDIPVEALKAGKLYCSIIGFCGSKKKTTIKWDIQQAITVQQCGALGDCDLLRNVVQYADDNIATDKEVDDMLDDVFGPSEDTGDKPDEGGSGDGVVDDDMVASDDEVNEMFDEVFGGKVPPAKTE